MNFTAHVNASQTAGGSKWTWSSSAPTAIPDALHFVKTTDREKKTATMFCGHVEPLAGLQPEGYRGEPGVPACGSCYAIVADLMVQESIDRQADLFSALQKVIDERVSARIDAEDDITLRLERLEKKASKKRGKR